jgi:hypothetical protein
MKSEKYGLLDSQWEELLETLKRRFEKNMSRHEGIIWEKEDGAAKGSSRCNQRSIFRQRVHSIDRR